MKKYERCNCKSGCQNKRCVCLRNNEPCDETCGCTGCRNPLNGLDLDNLTTCTIQNIGEYRALSEKALAAPHQLPCEDEMVPLKQLIGDYECSGCGETYWYSFCWDTVVQDSNSWHCEICGHCRDWREWHCEDCNNCTYGVSLPCEYCDAPGPFADMF